MRGVWDTAGFSNWDITYERFLTLLEGRRTATTLSCVLRGFILCYNHLLDILQLIRDLKYGTGPHFFIDGRPIIKSKGEEYQITALILKALLSC